LPGHKKQGNIVLKTGECLLERCIAEEKHEEVHTLEDFMFLSNLLHYFKLTDLISGIKNLSCSCCDSHCSDYSMHY
jgi:hypothetical protein